MIVRWLAGDEIDPFYERLQAHFDAALEGYREEERHTKAWKQDPKTLAYLEALDAIELKMAERYLREPIKTHGLFVLSTQSADELNIAYLADYVMSVPAADIVAAHRRRRRTGRRRATWRGSSSCSPSAGWWRGWSGCASSRTCRSRTTAGGDARLARRT
jgi:hypothetical protein